MTRGHGDGGLLLALSAALVAATVVSLLVGPAGLAPLRSLFAGGPDAHTAWVILIELRLPRTALGILVGAALGLSGAALQGYLRNPLAEPGLIGATAAASLGAVVALYTGLAALATVALPIGGMAGALAAVALVQLLAGRNAGPMSVILAGVAVTSFAGALTSLALNLAPSPFAALEIVYWMLGALTDKSWTHVALAAPFVAAGGLVLLTTARGLDALTLGDEAARSLGIDTDALRRRLIVGAALAVGAATSVAGSIGFVGLVVPHLLRRRVGHRPGALLLPSAFGGALLVLMADIVIRLVPTAQELKLGVLTALVGAPFFFHLVLKTRRTLT